MLASWMLAKWAAAQPASCIPFLRAMFATTTSCKIHQAMARCYHIVALWRQAPFDITAYLDQICNVCKIGYASHLDSIHKLAELNFQTGTLQKRTKVINAKHIALHKLLALWGIPCKRLLGPGPLQDIHLSRQTMSLIVSQSKPHVDL